jgi:hypothetical protein
VVESFDLWIMARSTARAMARGERAIRQLVGLVDMARRVRDGCRQVRDSASQAWRTFLDNHLTDIVAIDFFTVPTATCFPYWSDPLAIV